MEISGSSSELARSLQVKSAELANSQQEQKGEAALELIEAAEVPSVSSGNAVGSIIDTYA